MRDDLKEKLLRFAIKKKELEAFLANLGFVRKSGKGSHAKWLKNGLPPIILATHDKDLKPYMIKQVIKALKTGGIL